MIFYQVPFRKVEEKIVCASYGVRLLIDGCGMHRC